MRVSLLVAGVVLAMQPLAAQLQLSALDGLAAKAKESAEINLDAATLQMTRGFLGGDSKDAKTAELISRVKGIQVRAYEFERAGQYDQNLVRSIREQLQAQGWTKFVDIQEGAETFVLFSRSQNGRNTGFAMVAAEAKELAVIYIDGEISLAELGGLSGQFGIPDLPLDLTGSGKAKGDENKSEKGKAQKGKE